MPAFPVRIPEAGPAVPPMAQPFPGRDGGPLEPVTRTPSTFAEDMLSFVPEGMVISVSVYLVSAENVSPRIDDDASLGFDNYHPPVVRRGNEFLNHGMPAMTCSVNKEAMARFVPVTEKEFETEPGWIIIVITVFDEMPASMADFVPEAVDKNVAISLRIHILLTVSPPVAVAVPFLEIPPFVITDERIMVAIDFVEDQPGGEGEVAIKFLPGYILVMIGVDVDKIAVVLVRRRGNTVQHEKRHDICRQK